MEIVPTYVLNFTLMENEVAHWTDAVLCCLMHSVPYAQLSIVRTCGNLHVVVLVPLKSETFTLMSSEGQAGLKLGSSFHVLLFIDDENVAFRCS